MLDGIKFIDKLMHDTLDNCKVLVEMTDGTQKVVSGKELFSIKTTLVKDITFLE